MEKFFRLCPNCQQFFYSRNEFLSHQCVQDGAVAGSDERPEGNKIKRRTGRNPDADDQKEEKRQLRSQYIEFLKGKGVHMESERSFKKIEEAYRKHSSETVNE